MHRVNFHSNIIQFYGVTKIESKYYYHRLYLKLNFLILFIHFNYNIGSNYLLILEYADSDTLRNYLRNNFNRLDWNMKLQFAIQIADAVSCIHRLDIIHRDLVSFCFFRLLILHGCNYTLKY